MVIVVVLICFSALFSGLTLGLMGLDKVGLQIVLGAGNMEDATDIQKYQAKCAESIQPIREDGNGLLCTLLLGNVAVNAMLSILMADMTSGLMGFLISTIVIVIFGEIIPQVRGPTRS
jgi:metal transporter CNNM